MEGGGGVGEHYRSRGDEKHSGGGRLRRYGGLITGFADTFAGALEVSRAAILDAVNGPVSTFIYIDGREGTANPGGSTNRIESDDYPERDGTDRIFLALTTEQLEALGDAVGADVTAQ